MFVLFASEYMANPVVSVVFSHIINGWALYLFGTQTQEICMLRDRKIINPSPAETWELQGPVAQYLRLNLCTHSLNQLPIYQD